MVPWRWLQEHWPGLLQRLRACGRGPQPGGEHFPEQAALDNEHKWPKIPPAARAEDNDAVG